MQHEPVGDDYDRCKDTEFADRLEVYTEPHETEERQVDERGEGNRRSHLGQTDANTDRHGVRKGDGEDCLCLVG